jgi:hypothetical protein
LCGGLKKTLQGAKVLVPDSCYCQFRMYSRLDGLVQKKMLALQNALLNNSRVLIAKCPECFAGGKSQKEK